MNIVVLLQSNARSLRLQKKTTVSLRWEFDINRLCNETSIADNVVAVVLAKIQTLSPRLAQQVVLSLCCMSEAHGSISILSGIPVITPFVQE